MCVTSCLPGNDRLNRLVRSLEKMDLFITDDLIEIENDALYYEPETKDLPEEDLLFMNFLISRLNNPVRLPFISL